jgi:hypothetical protein
MSQASPDWSRRPTSRKSAETSPNVAALDKFVNGGKEEVVRLNVEIPKSLRARVKAGCAMEGREIKDVVIEWLEKRFPVK